MSPRKGEGGFGLPPVPQPLKSLAASFYYALRGLLLCLREERNLRIHLSASCWVIWLAHLCPTTVGERAALAVCCGLVICGELFNTAVEATVDLLSPAYHPIARRAKDISAAGVLMGAVFALVTGFIIFFQDGRIVGALALILLSPLTLLLCGGAGALTLAFVFFYPAAMDRLFPQQEGESPID